MYGISCRTWHFAACHVVGGGGYTLSQYSFFLLFSFPLAIFSSYHMFLNMIFKYYFLIQFSYFYPFIHLFSFILFIFYFLPSFSLIIFLTWVCLNSDVLLLFVFREFSIMYSSVFSLPLSLIPLMIEKSSLNCSQIIFFFFPLFSDKRKLIMQSPWKGRFVKF